MYKKLTCSLDSTSDQSPTPPSCWGVGSVSIPGCSMSSFSSIMAFPCLYCIVFTTMLIMFLALARAILYDMSRIIAYEAPHLHILLFTIPHTILWLGMAAIWMTLFSPTCGIMGLKWVSLCLVNLPFLISLASFSLPRHQWQDLHPVSLKLSFYPWLQPIH